MTRNNYNPELAHFVETKNAADKASGWDAVSIWIGYGSEQATNLYIGAKSTQGKPQLKMDFSGLKLAPPQAKTNSPAPEIISLKPEPKIPINDQKFSNFTINQTSKQNIKYAFGFGKEAENLAKEINGGHLMKDPNWKTSFLKIINDPINEIHFSLNGSDQTPMNMINFPGRSSTNWEMSELYKTPAFERTIFHYEGNTYKGFDVFKIKP